MLRTLVTSRLMRTVACAPTALLAFGKSKPLCFFAANPSDSSNHSNNSTDDNNIARPQEKDTNNEAWETMIKTVRNLCKDSSSTSNPQRWSFGVSSNKNSNNQKCHIIDEDVLLSSNKDDTNTEASEMKGTNLLKDTNNNRISNPQRWSFALNSKNSNSAKHFASVSVSMLLEPKRMSSANASRTTTATTTTTTTTNTATGKTKTDNRDKKRDQEMKLLEIYKELQETAKAAIGNQVRFNKLVGAVVASVSKRAKVKQGSHSIGATTCDKLGKWLYDWYAENGKKDDARTLHNLHFTVSQLLEDAGCDSATHMRILAASPRLHKAVAEKLAKIATRKKTLAQRVEIARDQILSDLDDKDVEELFGDEGLLLKKGVNVLCRKEEMKATFERWRGIAISILVDSASLVRRQLGNGKPAKGEANMGSKLGSALTAAANRVHIISGGSGTGKTSAALLMSALQLSRDGTPNSVTFLLLASHLPFCDQVASYGITSDQRHGRDRFTAISVLCAVYDALTGTVDSLAGDRTFKKKVSALSDSRKTYSLHKLSRNFDAASVGKIFREYFDRFDLVPSDHTVTIVVDEIGGYQQLLFGLTSVWQSDLRDLLATFLRVPKGNVHLVVAGTGAENFELAKCGSMPETYAVYSMQSSDKIFKTLLDHICRPANVKYHPKTKSRKDNDLQKKQWQECIAQFAKMMRSELYYDDDTRKSNERKSRIVDEATLRFHQLIRNARCAALAVEKITDVTVKSQVFSNSRVIARAMLPVICSLVVAEFQSMNGLAKYNMDTAEIFKLLSEAITIVLDRHKNVDPGTWERLATSCGLITDSAFYLKKALVVDSLHTEVASTTKSTPVVPAKRLKVGSSPPLVAGHELVYFSHLPRFRLSAPALPMFLTITDPLQPDSIFRSDPRGDSFAFEEVVADFIVTCALLPRDASVAQFPKQISGLTTSPREIFDFSKCATFSVRKPTVYRVERELPFQIAESNNQMPKDNQLAFEAFTQKRELREVREGKAIAVFVNGDRAPSGDVAALAPNTAMFVQVKYLTSSVQIDEAKEEFQKMEHHDVLQMMAECCVSDSATEFVFHSVFLVLFASSVPENTRAKWKNMLEAPQQRNPPENGPLPVTVNNNNNKVTVEIKRHIAYAVEKSQDQKDGDDDDDDIDDFIGNLYPVMNLPLYEMMPKRVVIDVNENVVDGKEKENGAPPSPQRIL